MAMRWMVTAGMLLFVCVVLVSCASMPGPDEMQAEIATYQLPKLPDDGKAIVYVVRPSSFGGKDSGLSFNVFLDSKDPNSEMGSTLGRQYIHFPVTPGEHKILSKAGNWAEISVKARPGDIVFIQQEPVMGLIDLNNELVRLPEYEGKYYVKTLTPGTFSARQPPTGRTQSRLEHAPNGPKDGTRSPSSIPMDGIRLPFSTIAVREVTQANGVGASPAFLQYFSRGLRDELVRAGVARHVIDERQPLAGVDSGDAVVLEGRLIGRATTWYGILVKSEITLYRRSDHALINTITPEVGVRTSPLDSDKNAGENTGIRTAYEIKKAMK